MPTTAQTARTQTTSTAATTPATAPTAASPSPVASRVAVPARSATPAPPVMRLAGASSKPAVAKQPKPFAKAGAGEPLAAGVRPALEERFGVDLSAVRVHTGAGAAAAAGALSARAFTRGTDIFLGKGERATDFSLLAHEVAHVVQQQGAPRVQRLSNAASDACESEAHRAADAASRGDRFDVRERTAGTTVQRWGIGDALDRFADLANAIPGYRMFTIVLGVNPINMSAVERSAANIMRAVVEFIPGGGLVTRALDMYGVFERVGGWVEGQIRSLGMTGGAIRQALMSFVGSLSLSDVFDLGGVWDRARRIFTEPISRIISFARGLITGILGFLREAVLRPLAQLAQGTQGYDLLKAVLGQDPVTGEAVPRNADTLIGGFMKLIGQEEVWNNLKRANAVARAWAWFQGALEGLMGYVRQVPGLIVSTLQSITLEDLLPLTNLFVKVGRAFGGFFGSFLSWAGGQVMSLLQIIFEVVAPGVMPYIRRAAGAFTSIIRNPIGFVGNLVRAGIQGFRQFAGNFLNHLRSSLIGWLTGTMSGAGIYIPQAFSVMEIIKFVLSVLGLTWQNIRGKLVRAVGETAVRALEAGFDIVRTLVTEGPAAAWQKILEGISNLREMVMEQVMSFVMSRVVQAAITRLVTSLNPAGAFIQAIIATYNTVMFFVERMRQIAQVVAAYIDSISAIAAGNIGAAASRVETTMAGLLTLVISFLARIAGLGRVSDAVVNIINRVRAPVDRALDRVVDWIVTTARRLGRLIAGGGRPAAAAAQPGAGAEQSVVKTFAMRGMSHRLTLRASASGLEVKMASSAEADLIQKVGDEINSQDGIIRALDPADTEMIGYHTRAKAALEGIRTWYISERTRINGLRPTQTPDQIMVLLRGLGEQLAARIVQTAIEFRLDDFVRRAFNVAEKLEAIRRQVEDQIEKHANNPAATGDGMAYTAAAAEMYLGWVEPRGQRHVDKVTTGIRVIEVALGDLTTLTNRGVDMTGERWFVRGRTVLSLCQGAINNAPGFLYGRGTGVVRSFITDMDARGIRGNPRAVYDAKRRLGMI